ncbi:MAG: Mrp/NBP35 family ATP-binding protein [Desulfovibrionaceae bacterium]|jgi:ATP-binding protein involved in chromosome partitioning|nr:Mrp/NBP35 family ATP-binding protein [Desulfovibrionaceae bacterium]
MEQAKQGHGVPIEQAMQDKMLAKNLSSIKYKLFIMSGKGGVGKSSVTVNLAAALAAKGFKVGVLDVDLHGPSVPRLLGATGRVRSDGQKLLPVLCGENISLISMDLFLDNTDQAVLWRGAMKTNAIRQFLTDVDWGALDYLLIDSPPGTGDEHMTVLEAIPDAMAVVVTTPQELALADVRKALDFLREMKSPILGIVENMGSFICPDCGKEYAIFKKGGGEKLAQAYNLPLLASIPLDPATVEAADKGVPMVAVPHDSPAKTAFQQLADRIMFVTRPKA